MLTFRIHCNGFIEKLAIIQYFSQLLSCSQRIPAVPVIDSAEQQLLDRFVLFELLCHDITDTHLLSKTRDIFNGEGG